MGLSLGVKLGAQSYIGLNTSNYAGIVGATIHPASIEGYQKKFDIVFLGLDAFSGNNYVSVVKESPFFSFTLSDWEEFILDNNGKSKYAIIKAEVTWPSFMIKTKQWGTVGFFARSRSYFNGNNLSPDFAEIMNFEFNNETLFNKKYLNQSVDLTANSWNELGILWAKVIHRNRNKQITVGVTPKILIGNGAIFAEFQADTLTNIEKNKIEVSEFNFAYGYSDNLNDLGGDAYDWKLGNTLNFGLDIGIEYTRYHQINYSPIFAKYAKLYSRSKKEENRYKYKISLSLLDLGRIKYTHGQDNSESSALLPNVDNIDISTIELDSLNALRQSLGSTLVLEEKTGTFTVGLPTTLQVGIDWHIKGRAYINGNLQMNMSSILKQADHTVNDLTNLTITPRWESKLLGLYLPVYINFNGITNFGLGMRAGPFAFGISDVGSFTYRKEVTSAGVYIVFKTYLRNKKEKALECIPQGWKSSVKLKRSKRFRKLRKIRK